MTMPYRVTLQGFTRFERSALASYFRLATNRNPAYEQVDTPGEAHFVVVDADDADAVRAVLAAGRAADTVFVGALAPQGASAWVMRPIDPLHVMRELDAMVHQRTAAQEARTAPPPGLQPPTHASAAAHASHGPRTVIQPRPPGQVPARRASDSEGSGFVPLAEPHQPVPPPPPRRGTLALLVDDSDIALRFLEHKLERMGLQTECATTSARAIEMLSHKAYDYVFLDVELGEASELDGLALCQHIKRHHHHAGTGVAPVVVLVSAHQSELDRVRGTLAGADAYVGKPLDDSVLQRLLRQHGVQPQVAANTPRTPSAPSSIS
jgi:CheY-like chemotaxis protein